MAGLILPVSETVNAQVFKVPTHQTISGTQVDVASLMNHKPNDALEKINILLFNNETFKKNGDVFGNVVCSFNVEGQEYVFTIVIDAVDTSLWFKTGESGMIMIDKKYANIYNYFQDRLDTCKYINL